MHRQLIDALDRRLARYESGDAAAVLHAQALEEADALLRMVSEPPPDASEESGATALAAVLRLHWYRYLVLPERADEPDRRQSLALFIRLLELDATQAPTDLAGSLITGVLERLRRRRLGEDPRILLSPVADLEARALEAFLERGRLADDGEQSAAVQLLAQVRWLRYLATPPGSGWPELTSALRWFEVSDRRGHALVPSLVREYLEGLKPDRGGQRLPAVASGWFGTTLATPENLRLAGGLVLRARRQLAEATDETQRLPASAKLCTALVLRYATAVHRRDLDECLLLGLGLLARPVAVPPDVLAEFVLAVGRALGVRADVDQSAEDQRRALRLLGDAARQLGVQHPAIPDIAESLIAVLSARSDGVDAAEFDRVIALIDACQQRGPEEQARWRLRRTMLQLIRYRHSGDDADLDEAVTLGSDLAAPLSSEDAYRHLVGSQLALALHGRFERTGRLADLNTAVAWMRKIVRRGGDSAAPWDRELLGNWLYERHSLVGHPQDLRDAVEILAGLVREHGSANLDVLSNAIVTALRADLITDEPQLREMVQLLRSVEASSGADDPARRMIRLVNLAAGLRELYHACDDHEALQEALDKAGEAVSMSTVDDPHHATVIEAYARLLLVRQTPSDVDAAIQAVRYAVGRATNAMQRAQLLGLLAAGHATRAGTGEALPGDRHAAMTALQEAASIPEAQPGLRRQTAYIWASEAVKLGDFASAAAGHAIAVDLVADLVWRATPLSDRRQELAHWASAARQGAACAVRAGRPDLAVQLLERGRGVLRSQVLQRRADLELVRRVRPDLAERMQWIQRTIEGFDQRETAENFVEYLQGGAGMLAYQMGSPESGYAAFPSWMPRSFEGIKAVLGEILGEQQDHSQDLRLAAIAEWDSLAEQLRNEPELAGVGRPPEVTELRSAATGGTVVMVNASSIGCDALIVTESTIEAVGLPDLGEEAAHQATQELVEIALVLEGGDRSAAARRRANDTIVDIQEWLWSSLAEPVLTALGHDRRPSPAEEWPRVWWCLTGPLVGLPVHAAGRRSRPNANVMGRVVSSYTTTVAALLRARLAARRHGRRQVPRLAAVGMPLTPQAPPLHGIEREIGELLRQLPGSSPALLGEQATVHSVAGLLKDHEWMHFACHGTPTVEGFPACLHLHDGPFSVHRVGRTALDHADLAYLSACHTADTSFSLPDEADHLAAAFQTAGYRHVVGTLWGAGDRISARVASSFYRRLAGPDGFTSDRAAGALHGAVLEVREANDDRPLLWAPFVHFGP
jgi:hypothetical protein